MKFPKSPAPDVLIIGGGVIGASIAFHLSAKGIKNILVIEKGSGYGGGSTSKATGGFRAQFGSEINVKLSLLSRRKLLEFEDEHGQSPGFLQYGYLFLAQNENELAKLKAANEMQVTCGLTEAEILTAGEILKLNPHINADMITGGSFCSTDGFISPMQILNGYINSAKRNGVVFQNDTEVTGFEVVNGRIQSVNTAKGNINPGNAVNAAGAWAGILAGFAGLELPVKPLKRQVALISEKNILPLNLPMTIWIDNSFHFRIRDRQLILLMPEEPENIMPFNCDVESSWLKKVKAIATDRIPAMRNCSIDLAGSWAGSYEMSPDEHLIIGKAPGIENFYLANGSSGHGVMHSPAIGQLLAEIITDGSASALNINELRPERFAEGNSLIQIEFC
jgi:sarcosine oxidase subunit beta